MSPDTVTVDRISFFVIKRGERLALRAKDKENPVLEHFTGMKYFPVNPAYRIEAKFIPDEHKIPVPNILGRNGNGNQPRRRRVRIARPDLPDAAYLRGQDAVLHL